MKKFPICGKIKNVLNHQPEQIWQPIEKFNGLIQGKIILIKDSFKGNFGRKHDYFTRKYRGLL